MSAAGLILIGMSLGLGLGALAMMGFLYTLAMRHGDDDEGDKK